MNTEDQIIEPGFKEIGASGAYFGFDNTLERLPTEQSWNAIVQDFEFTQHSHEIYQLAFRAFTLTNIGSRHEKPAQRLYVLNT